MPRMELISSTSEVVGFKSGLALTRRALRRYVPETLQDVWSGGGDEILRVRSEDYAEIVEAILYGVGAIRKRNVVFPGAGLYAEYRNDPERFKVFKDVSRLFSDSVSGHGSESGDAVSKRTETPAANGDPVSLLDQFGVGGLLQASMELVLGPERKRLDPATFVGQAEALHGPAGSRMAREFLEEVDIFLTRFPWGPFRRVEWKDVLELRDLFESESLEASYGTFVDQRFIDYLERNFRDIDRMNWRKFEGLTGEFFDRAGYHVEIGKGRGDDGVDARVWPQKSDRRLPPAILVQCKRQKEKVGKVVVKALYADTLEEGAQSGLIVTTSALSPGAEKTCTARGYPIGHVNRVSLRKWLQAMRTPGTGIFLGR